MDHRWLEIVINARSEELDDLCGKLIANGVPGLAVEEEEEFRAFLEENRQYWDYVDDALMEQMKGVSRVKIYVTDDADGQAQLKGYLAGCPIPPLPSGSMTGPTAGRSITGPWRWGRSCTLSRNGSGTPRTFPPAPPGC